MTPRGGVGKLHGFFQVRAAFGNEVADLGNRRARPGTGHAVHPQPRRPREGDDAERVLRLELRDQNFQRLMDDGHAVGPLHRAGIVEEQNEVQRPARLTAGGGGLDGEP
jgi:hypothetical protein